MNTKTSLDTASVAAVPSRMAQMTALGADWWNDSCAPQELAEAVGKGAVGATSNPVIVYSVVAENRAQWEPVIRKLLADHPTEIEDEIAWRLIHAMGRECAAILQPVFEKTHGVKGCLSMQVNPKFYTDPVRMTEQAAQLSSLAPNIAIKAPLIPAGLTAMEDMTARGIRVNATVSFTVAQAVAAAEAIERGLKRAGAETAARIHPYVTIMTGRVDDHLKRVQKAAGITVDTPCLDWAGIAVFRKTARIFRERGYRATLLAAAYRNEGHWREIIGTDVLQTIPYKWWKGYDAAAEPPRITINDPVDETYIAELRAKFPDFSAAYDEGGLAPSQFIKYGATVNTLTQFLGGYSQLTQLIREYMV